MKLRLGDEVAIGEARLRVVGLSPKAVSMRGDDGLLREVLIDDLVHDAEVNQVAPTPAADLEILSRLGAAQRKQVDFWSAHIQQLDRELRAAEALGQPKQRVYEVKVGELEAAGRRVTVRTLRTKVSGFRAHGLAALVDERLVEGRPRPRRVDDRLVAVLAEVMDGQRNASTGTRTRLIEQTRRVLEERFGHGAVEVPSKATMFRLIDEMDRGRHVTGSAKTRRSLANRPEREFAAMGVSRPGEQVQIDSTPLDVMVELADGIRVRPELTIMLDVATRSIVSAVVRPIATKSIDLIVLLARALVPSSRRPGGRVDTRELMSASLSKSLLRERDLAEYCRKLPYIFPDTITTDRGAIFVSEHFRAACQRLGISLNRSAPYTPTDKGKVERTFKSINTSFVEYLAGYTGRGVEFRGRESEADGLLSLPQLQELLDQWIAVEWQNRPHDALRDPLFPSRTLSPNEMARAYREIAPEVTIPFDIDTYLSLMPVIWRTIQHYGVTIDNRTYDSAGLARLRRTKSPYRERGGKWPIAHDPYNVQTVWVQVDRDWLPLHWVSSHIDGPMSGAVWDAARRSGAGRRDPVEESQRAMHLASIRDHGSKPERAIRKLQRAQARAEAVLLDPGRLSDRELGPAHEIQENEPGQVVLGEEWAEVAGLPPLRLLNDEEGSEP